MIAKVSVKVYGHFIGGLRLIDDEGQYIADKNFWLEKMHSSDLTLSDHTLVGQWPWSEIKHEMMGHSPPTNKIQSLSLAEEKLLYKLMDA